MLRVGSLGFGNPLRLTTRVVIQRAKFDVAGSSTTAIALIYNYALSTKSMVTLHSRPYKPARTK